MERSIIHLNVADFAVAVERAVDCRLRDRPVIIAPEGAVRAAVYDMSNEAYLAGIRKGMALRRAVRLAPSAWEGFQERVARLYEQGASFGSIGRLGGAHIPPIWGDMCTF